MLSSQRLCPRLCSNCVAFIWSPLFRPSKLARLPLLRRGWPTDCDLRWAFALVWSSRSSEQGDTVFATQAPPIAGAEPTIHLFPQLSHFAHRCALFAEEAHQFKSDLLCVRPRDAVWASSHHHQPSPFDEFGRPLSR